MSVTLLIKPIITEKSFALAQAGKFTFTVSPSATKHSVKQAVEDQFKVEVIKVNITNLPKKLKTSGKKRLKIYSDFRKKAVVTLKSGQTIEYFQLPDDAKKSKKSSSKAESAKTTPSAAPVKRGFFGLGKRKEQRTQDK